MRVGFLISIVICSSIFMSVASAQDVAVPVPLPPPLPTETEYAGPTIGITFSPIHLVFPVVELAVEVRAAPKMGVVVLGGVGTITPENATDAYSVWEAGAQFRYYAVGDFRHGMQVGAEALYVNVSDTAQNITITANGLAAGPFIGYKYTAPVGFTVDLQGGVQFFVAGANDNAGNTASRKAVIPLFNANIGWSF